MEGFPLLIQWSSDPVVYHGFLSVMDRELEVWVVMPPNSTGQPPTTPMSRSKASAFGILSSNAGCIYGTEELKDILSGREATLQQKMEGAESMESFLIELVDTLEAILSSRAAKAENEKSVSYWASITEQLDTLGWDKVAYLSEDLSRVQIDLCDASQRKHVLTVTFPRGYPVVPLILEPLEVPDCDVGQRSISQQAATETISWDRESGLGAVIRHAEKQLDIFKDFWDVMQDLDEKTWVIDPEKPTRADRMRRCALGNHCSIQMTIDPLSPRSMPDTRLFGPATSIEPMRSKLYQNSGLWNDCKLPRENLEVLLELPNGFPSPVTVTKDEMNIECGICYSFRFDGRIPDQLCSHSKCQQPFHRVCLYEWLRSVPTTRQSFNTLFGACPYCTEAITVTAPKA
ncbi:E3 ubiquitin-protein ligase FANCL-like protein [Mortierella sp. GBAus27b]|nr:E3 ubiquitin-protein ligase FANCL-like protein [Mortierella sp. GBAus27b]